MNRIGAVGSLSGIAADAVVVALEQDLTASAHDEAMQAREFGRHLLGPTDHRDRGPIGQRVHDVAGGAILLELTQHLSARRAGVRRGEHAGRETPERTRRRMPVEQPAARGDETTDVGTERSQCARCLFDEEPGVRVAGAGDVPEALDRVHRLDVRAPRLGVRREGWATL